MALTKKQKQNIRKQLTEDTVAVISRNLGVPESDIVAYVQAAGLHRQGRPAPTHGRAPSSGLAAVLESRFGGISIITILAAIVGLWCFDGDLYISGDNVEFIRYGEELAGGTWSIGNGKFPAAFPAALAIAQSLTGGSLVAQKLLVLCCYILAAPLTFLVARRYVGAWWALTAAFMFLASPLAIEFSHYVMSEIPYCMFSLAALWLLQVSRDRNDDVRMFLGGLALVVASYYVRTAGMALMAAVIAWYLVDRRWKLAAWAAGVSIAGMTPLWINNAMRGGQGYFQQLILKNAYNPDLGYIDLSDLLQRLTTNLAIYFKQDIPLMAFPVRFETTIYHTEVYSESLALFLSLVVLGLIVYAFFAGPRLLAWYAAAFFSMLMLWPEFWSGERFAVPLLPLLTIFLVFGIAQMQNWIARISNPPLAVTIGALCAAGLIAMYGQNILRFNVLAQTPPEWSSYYKAAAWVGENAEPDAIICDRKGTLFGYVSHRTVVWLDRPQTTRDVLQQMYDQKVDYVVYSSIPYSSVAAYLVPVLQTYSDWFQNVFQIRDPQTYVFRLNRDKPLPD